MTPHQVFWTTVTVSFGFGFLFGYLFCFTRQIRKELNEIRKQAQANIDAADKKINSP